MICNYCHTEIDSNSIYCLICGKKVNEDDLDLVKKDEYKIWSVFANIGHKAAFFCLIFSFLLSISIFGYISIVLSALGMQSTTQKEKAYKGLKMGIASVAINHVLLTVGIVLAIVLKWF
jgi:hypothetical protein